MFSGLSYDAVVYLLLSHKDHRAHIYSKVGKVNMLARPRQRELSFQLEYSDKINVGVSSETTKR